MKIYIAVLVFFLAAFACLASGLLLKRKGLRGGCSSHSRSDKDCHCQSTTDSIKNSED